MLDPALVLVPGAAAASGVASVELALAATRRRAATRTEIDLIPSRAFDPSVEELTRLASAIASTRRPGPRPTRAADAVRISLVTIPPGRLGYRLCAPADLMAALRPHLPAGLSIREPEPTEPDEDSRAIARYTARREMVLARPDGAALAVLPLDPDPLTAFAKVFSTVGPNEDLTVCFDLMALSHERHAAVREERSEDTPTPRPRARLDLGATWRQVSQPLGAHAVKAPPAPRAPGNTARSRGNASAKPGSPAPLFHVQCLAVAQAATRARAKLLVEAATGAPLRQWASPDGGNWWEPRAIAGRATANWPLVRGVFDARLESGTFPGARRKPRVASSEILGLLKPPTAKNTHADLRRSGAAAPPPRGLLPFVPGVRPLGIVDGYDGIVGTDWEEFFFGGSMGRSRWGKTSDEIFKFLSWVADHPWGMGLGGAYVDPAHDAIGLLSAFAASFPGRAWLIDLGRQWEDLWLPCWNPFDARGHTDQEANAAMGAVVSAFQAVTKWSASFAPRATAIITACATALIALARELPAGGPVPTFFQIPTLITDEAWRKAVIRHLPRQIRDWWENEFPRLPKDAPLTVTFLISRLRANVPTAAFLGSRTTLNYRKAMDAGEVLLFGNSRRGDNQDAIPTSLFVRGMLMGGASRADVPADLRRIRCPRFLEVFDEAPTYDGPDLATAMQEHGKYGITTDVLAQSPLKLKPGTLEAIFTNGSAIASTSVSHAAAAAIAAEWQGAGAADIMDTAKYTFLTSVVHDGRRSQAFHVRPTEPHTFFPQDPGALERSLPGDPRYRLATDVVAELDHLDEAILAALGEDPVGRKPPADGGLQVADL